MTQQRRLAGAAMLMLLVAVTFVAGCSGGTKSRTPTPTPGATASDPSPEATAAPAAETINGVAVTPLRVGKPADIPAGVVLYIEGGCTRCDGPATSLDRVYRDAAGTLHSERLFERKLRVENNTSYEENYIRTMRVSSTGNDIVIGVCDRGYCGGVGNATLDARTTFYGSNDGGISWKEIGQLAGDTWIIALSGPTAMIRHAFRPSEGAPYTWEIVQLPGGGAVGVDPTIDVKTASFVAIGDGPPAVVAPDGVSLLSLAASPSFQPFLGPELPVGSQILDARISPGGGAGEIALVRWTSQGGATRSYLGLMKDRLGKPVTIFAETPEASIGVLGQWLAPSTLVGNAMLPATALESPLATSGNVSNVPSLTDLKTGEVRAIKPLIDRVLKGDRARILAAAPGPFVKVAGAGECLNVRSLPEKAAFPIACYKDGVLLKDLGETSISEGITWFGVWARRDGGMFAGWASAEFLEASGRDPGPKPIAHPRGKRTGDAAIDTVLAAIESRDQESILRLVQFQSVACTTDPGLGGPPKCPPGVANGTMVEALTVSGCDGSWLLKEAFLSPEGLAYFFRSTSGLGVYAVYRPVVSAEPPRAGETVIIFVREVGGQPSARTMGVTGGRIVSNWGGCGTLPENIFKGALGATVILAPPQ